MVVQSGFRVQLVDAHTKKPLTEFEKDGKHYVEAEPGLEYLIKMQRVDVGKNALYLSPLVKASFEIDGTNLGFNSTGTFLTEVYRGSWERKDGVQIKRSLKFERPKYAARTTASSGVMGTVRVSFHQAIKTEKKSAGQNFVSNGLACEVDKALTPTKAKIIRSSAGSQVSTEQTATDVMYEFGRHLDSITIYYCTTLGLVKEGILPKPKDIWEHARMDVPAKRPLDPRLAEIEPKKMKRAAVTVDGIEVMQEQEYDLFDLSNLNDSDTEKDDP